MYLEGSAEHHSCAAHILVPMPYKEQRSCVCVTAVVCTRGACLPIRRIDVDRSSDLQTQFPGHWASCNMHGHVRQGTPTIMSSQTTTSERVGYGCGNGVSTAFSMHARAQTRTHTRTALNEIYASECTRCTSGSTRST